MRMILFDKFVPVEFADEKGLVHWYEKKMYVVGWNLLHVAVGRLSERNGSDGG